MADRTKSLLLSSTLVCCVVHAAAMPSVAFVTTAASAEARRIGCCGVACSRPSRSYRTAAVIGLRGSSGSSEEEESRGWVAQDMAVLRSRMSQAKEQSLSLPGPHLAPEEVITQTLKRLQNNDDPYTDSGVETLIRLASDRFKLQLRWLGTPAHKPRALSQVLRNENSQFHLLMCKYDHHFPLDTFYIDENRAFVDVQFDAPLGGKTGDKTGRVWNGMLAKVGFEMLRREDGVWMFDVIIWHDFRDCFRPGIGQEEWPRICG